MFGGRKKVRHVVVSYATGDRREAFDLVQELEARGIAIWIAPRDVDPARGIAPQIQDAIRNAACVLLVVSRAANESKVLKTEAEIAVGTAPIIPVRIEDRLPEAALRTLVHGQPVFDLFSEAREAELVRLVDTVSGLQGNLRSRRATPAPRPVADPVVAPDAASAIADGDRPETTTAVLEVAPDGPPPLGHNAALRAFVGPGANEMMERWREIEGRDVSRSPFLAGLLFGRYWLIHRKLFGLAGVSSLIAIALVAFALWTDDLNMVAGTPIAVAGIVALAIPVWLWGIGLYRDRAEKVVDRLNAAPADADEAAGRLSRRGGVSWIATASLAIVEIGAAAMLVRALDPGLVAWLTTQDTAPALEKLELVDMTHPIDGKARYNFCVVNPTDVGIHFVLRYGRGDPQSKDIEPHSKLYTFWSKEAVPPTIAFDHVLGDGATYTERSYDLDTARTEDQTGCGGFVYYFTATGNDLDLKLREADDAAGDPSKS